MTRLVLSCDHAPYGTSKAHGLAVEIQKLIAAKLKPGAVPEEIYEDAKAMADESPWGGVFMGYGDNQVKFVGHGVGLELDELPVLAATGQRDVPLDGARAWGTVGFAGRCLVGAEHDTALDDQRGRSPRAALVLGRTLRPPQLLARRSLHRHDFLGGLIEGAAVAHRQREGEDLRHRLIEGAPEERAVLGL